MEMRRLKNGDGVTVAWLQRSRSNADPCDAGKIFQPKILPSD